MTMDEAIVEGARRGVRVSRKDWDGAILADDLVTIVAMPHFGEPIVIGTINALDRRADDWEVWT